MTLQALSGFYSRRRGLAQISHQRLFLNKEPTMSVHEEPERPEIEIYREMLDHLEDIVFCHDPDGRFLFMSPAAEKFLGYRSEDLPGLDFSQIIPTDYLEEVMRRTELQRRKQPVAQPWELQVFNRQGERVWVQIRTKPLYDAQGNLLRVYEYGPICPSSSARVTANA